MKKSRVGEFVGVLAIVAVGGLLMADPPAARSSGRPSRPPEPADLVLHLPLDGTALDSSENAFRATPAGIKPAVDRHGNDKGACAFGAGSFIEITDYEPFAHLEELTVSAWIKPAALGEGVCLLANSPEGRDFALNLTKHGQMVAFFAGGEQISAYTDNSLIEPGIWTFITASNREGKWSFSVDGKPVAAHHEGSFPSTGMKQPPPCLTIGSFTRGAPDAFVGSMDDLRIHRRVLGDLEIAALMKS